MQSRSCVIVNNPVIPRSSNLWQEKNVLKKIHQMAHRGNGIIQTQKVLADQEMHFSLMRTVGMSMNVHIAEKFLKKLFLSKTTQ